MLTFYPGGKPLIVVGDMHGQLKDLLTIFTENGFPGPAGPQYLFNGDFVDRGTMGAEVATILLAYKMVYPDLVHLNRGNHETIMMNMNYGFIDEVPIGLRGVGGSGSTRWLWRSTMLLVVSSIFSLFLVQTESLDQTFCNKNTPNPHAPIRS